MIKFEFNGVNSDKYGIIITKLEDNTSLISRSVITGEKNRFRPRENHFGTMYDNNYSFTLGLSKSPCASRDNGYFTSNEIKRINSWLTSPQLPKKFKFINNEYFDEEIEFFVVFTAVEAEHVNKPHELIFNVVCDSPYGYTPLIIHNIESSSVVTTPFVISNNSDELEDYIYPLIKIKSLGYGKITIKNLTDKGEISIEVLKNVTFYIDCKRLKIYDDTNQIISFDDLGISDVDSIYWPRLCSGINNLEFKGAAEIEITYREPRKVGVFYGNN